jgi:hypothetical protein
MHRRMFHPTIPLVRHLKHRPIIHLKHYLVHRLMQHLVRDLGPNL